MNTTTDETRSGPTLNRLADYLLTLYARPTGCPGVIIADLWRLDPHALPVIVRAWAPDLTDGFHDSFASLLKESDLEFAQKFMRELAKDTLIGRDWA